LRDRADFSLIESLRTVPGFRVQQLGGFGRTANIKTRGLRNQDTAILIDGIRFRDASSITGDASPFLSDFTLTSVNRIEVLRGSGSSLYRTNAIGGTIDFQTPKPTVGLHGQIGGAFGGYGLQRFRANLSDGRQDDKFGFNLGVSRTVYSKGIDGEDDAHNTIFQSRIEYNPFSKTNISGRLFVTDAYVRLNSSPVSIGTLPASNTTIIGFAQIFSSDCINCCFYSFLLNICAKSIPVVQLFLQHQKNYRQQFTRRRADGFARPLLAFLLLVKVHQRHLHSVNHRKNRPDRHRQQPLSTLLGNVSLSDCFDRLPN
jgi:hypothetical protein